MYRNRYTALYTVSKKVTIQIHEIKIQENVALSIIHFFFIAFSIVDYCWNSRQIWSISAIVAVFWRGN